jgi:hypothetical protein
MADDDDGTYKPRGSGSSDAFQAGFKAASNKKKAGNVKSAAGGGGAKAGGGGKGGGGGGGLISKIGSLFGGSKKKGGPVRKTGLYLVHKNEYVVPAKRSGRKTSHKRAITKL